MNVGIYYLFYLQILNQPLAPQTLQFLYQLLQQIKVLTQLQQQQILNNSMSKQGVPNANLQLNVQIAQTKQRINNLQNQICANQALYLKQVSSFIIIVIFIIPILKRYVISIISKIKLEKILQQ